MSVKAHILVMSLSKPVPAQSSHFTISRIALTSGIGLPHILAFCNNACDQIVAEKAGLEIYLVKEPFSTFCLSTNPLSEA